MRRGRRWLHLWLLVGSVLPSCHRAPPPPAPAGRAQPDGRAAEPLAWPWTVHDQLQRAVTLPRPAVRIVSLSPALTEILFAVGCGDRLVLRDGWSDFPAQAANIASVKGFTPNAEAILAARPDLLLAHFPPPALRTALAGANVPWLGFAPETLAQVADSIRVVSKTCGRAQAGEALATAFTARLAAIQARVAHLPQPRVFYEMDAGIGGRPYTISKLAFGHAILQGAGGRNVFAEAQTPWFQVSPEAVLAADPDVVLLADADAQDQPQSLATFKARPGMAALRAVQAGRVVALRSDWVSRPGPRLPLGVEAVARALHPEALRDLPAAADLLVGTP